MAVARLSTQTCCGAYLGAECVHSLLLHWLVLCLCWGGSSARLFLLTQQLVLLTFFGK